MAFRQVSTLDALWSGDLLAATVDGVAVVVLRTGDIVRAYADRCAHLGVELSKGSLDGDILTCSAHHWQYDATTGRGVNPTSACLVRYATKVEDGAIFVDVGAPVSGPG
jgi:toluene monooxygenase system ferredoxin subunit